MLLRSCGGWYGPEGNECVEAVLWDITSADAVEQQARVFSKASLLHVNFAVQQSTCNGPGRRMAASWNLQGKIHGKNQVGSI